MSTSSVDNKSSSNGSLKSTQINTSQNNSVGHLTIIFGPMRSDKTTEGMNRATKFADRGYKVLYIVNAKDNRECKNIIANAITTHSSTKKELSSLIDVIKIDDLSKIEDTIIKYHSIIIDEAQFFEKLKESVSKWVTVHKKNVIVVGLNGDSNMELFGEMHLLIPKADQIVHLRSTCQKCDEVLGLENIANEGVPAPFTSEKIHSKKDQVLVGSGHYISVCRKHYEELNLGVKTSSMKDNEPFMSG